MLDGGGGGERARGVRARLDDRVRMDSEAGHAEAAFMAHQHRNRKAKLVDLKSIARETNASAVQALTLRDGLEVGCEAVEGGRCRPRAGVIAGVVAHETIELRVAALVQRRVRAVDDRLQPADPSRCSCIARC